MLQKDWTMAAAVGIVLALGPPASAAITVGTVIVGDAGNAGELSGAGAGAYGPDRICGAVEYAYAIGRYEITNAQYTAFLNAVARSDPYGLYSADMGSQVTCPYGDLGGISRSGTAGSYAYNPRPEREDWPVAFVSFWDACRFTNWLHNGQPVGVQDATTTEDGAYTLNGYTGTDGRTIGRNPDATWVLPNEDEWYKAAFYKGTGTAAGYWDYATRNDSAPTAELPLGGSNSANRW